MKLRLSRSQKTGGVMSQHVIFCLDARAELTPDEAEDVKKYHLGNQVVYNSQRAKEYLDRSQANAASGKATGMVKAFAGLAMAKLALNITNDSLVRGHHIEAKDMDEMLGAEAALRSACENMKAQLAIAATFDGKEEVIEY